jgi:cholest-4-en-3-one 26-monooxygenase
MSITAPAEFDILDPRFFDDPWETYRWLRNEAPIFWDEKNQLWLISKHEDVSHISRNQERYSAAQGVRPKLAAPMSIIAMDDPEHTRQRRLVNKGFTPRMVRELSDHMKELSHKIIDQVAHKGEIEFVEELAIHVPLIVIAELMGLNPEQRENLYHWSDQMMAGDGHLDPDDPVLHAAGEAFGQFAAVAYEIIEQRRATGDTSDLIGIITNAFDEGELTKGGLDEELAGVANQLSNDELLMFLVLLVVAGNETTRNALSGGLHAFSRFPSEREKLIADPELIEGAADEIVRFVSPVLSFSRTVTEDHTYKGVDFKAGDRVLLLYQSANRDEDVFEDPDTFDIERSPNPHLGFGIGTHYCLGANLARAEIKTVFSTLFERLHDIRVKDLDALVERGDSSLVISIKSLPAVFTPEAK